MQSRKPLQTLGYSIIPKTREGTGHSLPAGSLETKMMMGVPRTRFSLSTLSAFVLLGLIFNAANLYSGKITSSYVRADVKVVDLPLNVDVFRVPPGYNAPQQVHITQGDHNRKTVIVSWVTADESGSSEVTYWAENSNQQYKAKGEITKYKFYNYTSGYIHHTTIRHLEYNTKYYYQIGIGQTTRTFWFVSPPEVGPDVAYTFGLIGDLGQIYDSNRTLTHYESNPTKGQAVLYVGDFDKSSHSRSQTCSTQMKTSYIKPF